MTPFALLNQAVSERSSHENLLNRSPLWALYSSKASVTVPGLTETRSALSPGCVADAR